jgi:hypothetical protein
MPAGRKGILAVLAFGALCLVAPTVTADEVLVPVGRQAELTVRVAAYDRNLHARSHGVVRVVILVNPDDPDSRSVGAQMDAALRRFDVIAGLPYDIVTRPFSSGAELAALVRQDHVSIVYVTQGLDAKLPELVAALNGLDVLSVAAVVRFVDQGVVLGFDLVSAKPTLVLNLPQAGRQNVSIEATVLHLMKVIQ